MSDIDGDWRQERNDYIEGSLLDEQERIDFEHQRDVDLDLVDERPTRESMIEHAARERFEVENRWELRRIAERADIEQRRRERWERAQRGRAVDECASCGHKHQSFENGGICEQCDCSHVVELRAVCAVCGDDWPCVTVSDA